ncbi:hypothetical protein [Microbacterium halophytorum]|uniref:hypothetical protein n=1 Tax=Microbacterium halophytorum TaxID=2067568 RepID=UPI00131A362A|nr:hypothetical protein [Microbacterium halophytorum]
MDSEFAPVGSGLLVAILLLLGGMLLFFALSARRGKPERNYATADGQDLRSVIWTSEATWRAAHRANAPWLFAASGGAFAGGAAMIGAMIVLGAGEAASIVLSVLCVALGWVIVCGTCAGIAGRAAAKRARAQEAAESPD